MYKRLKKGQAALEFLMTYGWAILVVLVVIGALAYFGVFDMNALFPDRCTLGNNIQCAGHKVSASSAEVFITNGIGEQMQVMDVAVFREDKTGNIVEGCKTAAITSPAGDLNNGAGQKFTVSALGWNGTGYDSGTTCAFADLGNKEKYQVEMNYKIPSTGITHLLEGEILTKMES